MRDLASVNRRQVLATLGGGALGIGMQGAAWAQEGWPDKPIRLIVPSAPGGGGDFVGRSFQRYLETQLKVPIVVENKPGAGTIIGTAFVKNAAPDGYTYLISTSSSQAANVSLYKTLPYDPAKDFVEIGIFGVFPNIAVVKPGSPLRSIADIIREAKARPGKISYGYYSSSAQVPPALIQSQTGIEMIAVSYKNITAVITDIIGGILDFSFLDALSVASALQGRLTPIAVTSPTPWPNLPNVPPVAATLPGFEVQSWLGLAAPAGTPEAIVNRMNGYVRATTADPAIQAALLKQGMTVLQLTAAEHSVYVAADRRRWAEWARIAKIEPQ